jgi:hypothetical protein
VALIHKIKMVTICRTPSFAACPVGKQSWTLARDVGLVPKLYMRWDGDDSLRSLVGRPQPVNWQLNVNTWPDIIFDELLAQSKLVSIQHVLPTERLLCLFDLQSLGYLSEAADRREIMIHQRCWITITLPARMSVTTQQWPPYESSCPLIQPLPGWFAAQQW